MKKAIPLIALGLSVLIATTAHARSQMITSLPEANSTAASPKRILLQFNEKFDEKVSGFALFNDDGDIIPLATTTNGGEATLNADLKTPLPAGDYKIIWHTIAPNDGQRSEGKFRFTVK